MTEQDKAKQKKGEDSSYLIGDMVMLVLLIINLLMISFDWLFQSAQFREMVAWVSTDFHDFYESTIHVDFILYDLAFIAIFLAEFFFRWFMSIRKSEYAHWYYFPFIYWYDLVGCIPIGGFRFLRLLRIITIMVRLQRMGYVDFTQSGPYRFVMHYFNIFVQEVTDRVTLKILSNVREELHQGTPVIERIVADVLRPRQGELINWISVRLQLAASKGYAIHEEEIRDYVHERINEAVNKNKELKNLGYVPVIGRVVASQIEEAIRDIVFNVVHGIIRDLGSSKNRRLVEDVSGLLLEEDTMDENGQVDMLNVQVADILSESVGIIMERVKQRRWDPKELQEAEERIEKKLREE